MDCAKKVAMMSTIGLWTDVLRSWVWYVGRRHLGILEPEGTVFGRGGGAIIVSLTINETIMCKMNILFYWRRLETNSCGNNLLKYKSSEMWVHFFCIDFHTSDFFFETKCVVSFWTCKLKTLVHWLHFSDPAAICLYSLYLLHVIVAWPKFQFETFTWPLC